MRLRGEVGFAWLFCRLSVCVEVELQRCKFVFAKEYGSCMLLQGTVLYTPDRTVPCMILCTTRSIRLHVLYMMYCAVLYCILYRSDDGSRRRCLNVLSFC